ncbi:hypothetical protein GCM10027610_030580 [Dactylosporangium cerinum]
MRPGQAQADPGGAVHHPDRSWIPASRHTDTQAQGYDKTRPTSADTALAGCTTSRLHRGCTNYTDRSSIYTDRCSWALRGVVMVRIGIPVGGTCPGHRGRNVAERSAARAALTQVRDGACA